MSYWEIFKEIATKGLRTVNDEINEGVPSPAKDAGQFSESPLIHTRPGFEKFHPAHYDPSAQPTARVA